MSDFQWAILAMDSSIIALLVVVVGLLSILVWRKGGVGRDG